jgi:hypothetical protein
LAFRDFADQDFAVLGEGHDRGSGAGAFGVCDDRRLAALKGCNDGVGGAEVDSDSTGHVSSS